jgi:hypothetical protein
MARSSGVDLHVGPIHGAQRRSRAHGAIVLNRTQLVAQVRSGNSGPFGAGDGDAWFYTDRQDRGWAIQQYRGRARRAVQAVTAPRFAGWIWTVRAKEEVALRRRKLSSTLNAGQPGCGPTGG